MSEPVELLSDFTPKWAKIILEDPQWRAVTTFGRQKKPPPNTENSLFARSLWSSDCVRAVASFHRGSADAAFLSNNESRMIFSLGDGVHGHSGFSHGGFIGMLIDEVTGQYAATIYGRGIYTVELSVKFMKLMPTPAVVLCRSWLEREPVGRKVWLTASIEDGQGGIFATGEALFITERSKL